MATIDQLAQDLEHDTVESGTFKMKLATARIFGVAEIKGERVSLTDLGNRIARSADDPHALSEAFIRVPLFRAIYLKYKGRLLPGDAVLEADMKELGVSSKQTSRARQAFQRSASQAKLGKDRLVLPAGVSLDSTTPQNGEKGRQMETQTIQPSGEVNPLLASLIEELPATGEWTRDEHDLWMRLFQRTLNKLYKVKE